MEENKEMAAPAAEEKNEVGAQPIEKEAPAAPAAEGESPEASEPKAEPAPRDLFYERIRTNFPEGKYDEDEDEYYRNANSRFDELEKDSKSFKDLSAKLESRFDKDPREAEVFLDWLDGIDIRTAITRHMGAEALTAPEEGSDEYEEWSKAGEEHKAKLAKMKEQVDTYRANLEKSGADYEEFIKENGLSDEQADELSKWLTEEFVPKVYNGQFDKNFYKLINNARNYDNDIEGAREQGRVDGRNEKIEVEKKRIAGSGLPNAKSGGNASEEVDAKPTENKTVDWLDKMSKRRV